MTNHEQQAAADFEKYVAEKGYSPSEIGVKDMIAFAAFCLEKQKAGFTKEIRRRQLKIISEPDGIVRETMIATLLIDFE